MKNPLQTFPVSAGLLDPRHVKAIDPSSPWPIYLWFLEHITRDEERDDDFVGIVLHGRSISIRQIAEELGIKGRTCRRNLARLVKADYVLQKQTGAGTCTYTVTKSKRWAYKRRTSRTELSKAPESQASLSFPNQGESVTPAHQKMVNGSRSPHQILVEPDQKVVSAERGTRARSQVTKVLSQGERQKRSPRPETLNIPRLAEKVIGILSLTNSISKKKIIEASIVAEASHCGFSVEDAAQAITQYALRDGRRGLAIDRWYFEDTKWRPTGKLDGMSKQPVPLPDDYIPASEHMRRLRAAVSR
jgi:DNA-binding transcriptional regulator YhcF (GntR family)